MRIIAVVPAKGISRRVPGKNLLTLAGIPMFCHSIITAASSLLIDEILVSSDSEEVLRQAEKYGARSIPRPPRLCIDTATNFQVLCHIMEILRDEGNIPDILLLLQPTTPFRSFSPLDRMVEEFLANPTADSLITVAPTYRMRGQIINGFWIPLNVPAAGQRLKTSVAERELTGHAFVLRPERTLDRGSLLGERILAVDLPDDWLDVDIDTPNDFIIAQAIASTYFRNHYK